MTTQPTIVLGIDPGFAIVGWGVIEIAGKEKTVKGLGVIRTATSQSFPARLETLFQETQELIARFQPTVVGIEQIYFYQNITTGINVAQARGVLVLAAQLAHLSILDPTPLQVKNTITGFGRATKTQIQEMVCRELRLKEKPTPDDCTDALAIALTTDILHRSSLYAR